MGGEGEVAHNIFDDESEKANAFRHCHFIGLYHLYCEFDAVESLSAVEHHAWQKTGLNGK